MITKETRFESYIARPIRANEILELMGEEEMTARQIMQKSKYSDMNAIRPRLTELKALGKIEAVGKAYDKATNRSVAVFRVVS
jgi:predicted HTH transcriptional regulator